MPLAFAGGIRGPGLPGAPGPSPANGQLPPPGQAQSEPNVRSNFPETWIWTDVNVE